MGRKSRAQFAQLLADQALAQQKLPPPPAEVPDVAAGDARSSTVVTVGESEAIQRAREAQAVEAAGQLEAARQQLVAANEQQQAQAAQLEQQRKQLAAAQSADRVRVQGRTRVVDPTGDPQDPVWDGAQGVFPDRAAEAAGSLVGSILPIGLALGAAYYLLSG